MKPNKKERKYQSEGKEKILSALAESSHGLYVLPTGAGKTRVFGMVAKVFLERKERVCVVVHKTVLTDQTIESIAETCGVPVKEVGKLADGKWTKPDASLLVCMAPSLASQIKRGVFAQEKIGLVILDEAHRSLSPTFLRIVEHFKADGVKILGVTATPERLDGKPMGEVYATMVRGPSFGDVTDAGYIARPIYYAPSKEVLPYLKGVKRSGGDHSIAALSGRCVAVVDRIVEQWQKRRPKTGGTLVFAVDIEHANKIEHEFREKGETSVEVATSKKAPEVVEAIFARLKSGETKVVINVMIAVEGFDAPGISCLVIARPTLSRGLYIQMVGRALRKVCGHDHACGCPRPVILDHTTNTRIFGKAELYHAPELGEDTKPPGYLSETVERACPACGCLTLAAGESCEECGYTFKASDKREVVTVDGELVELDEAESAERKSHPCMCGCGEMSPPVAYQPSQVARRMGRPWVCLSLARRFQRARDAGYNGTIGELASRPYKKGYAVCTICGVAFKSSCLTSARSGRGEAVRCPSCAKVIRYHTARFPSMGHHAREFAINRAFLREAFPGLEFDIWFNARKPDSRGIPTIGSAVSHNAIDMAAAIEAVRQGIPLRSASDRDSNAAGDELVQKLESMDLPDEELSVASRPPRRRTKASSEAAE